MRIKAPDYFLFVVALRVSISGVGKHDVPGDVGLNHTQVREDREIRGGRVTGKVGGTSSVHGDTEGGIQPAAAEIGKVAKREGLVGVKVEPRHERISAILRAAARIRLLSRGRQLGEDRKRVTSDVGTSFRIHRDGPADVPFAAAKIGRVTQERIDDERLGGIILAECERNSLVTGEFVARSYEAAFAVNRLIGDGLFLAELTGTDTENEIAAVVDAQLIRAIESHRNDGRIDPGR